MRDEAMRVKHSNINDLREKEPLVVNNLYKKFKKNKTKFVAVNHMSFGVQKRSVLGMILIKFPRKILTLYKITFIKTIGNKWCWKNNNI